MNCRILITAEDNRYNYWMCEVANYTLQKINSSNKLTCLYGNENLEGKDIRFPLSFDHVVFPSRRTWKTKHNSNITYVAANKPFLFYEYLKQGVPLEENILLIDPDTCFIHDLEERVSDPNVVRTGLMDNMNASADGARYILDKFLNGDTSLIFPSIGIYLFHRDSVLDIAKKWCERTYDIIHDKDGWEACGWLTEAWAYISATAELKIKNIANNRGLQSFCLDNHDDPILHFYWFPKTKEFNFKKFPYEPWKRTYFDENWFLSSDKIGRERLSFFFKSLNELADINEHKILSQQSINKYTIEDFHEISSREIYYPFSLIVDENDSGLGIISLLGPFRSEKDEQKYKEYIKMGYKFIGTIENDLFLKSDSSKYYELCDAWCGPSYLLPKNINQIDLNICDFVNPRKINKSFIEEKIYDFAYMFDENDNWEIVEKYLILLCNKLNLRGVIIGAKNKCNNVNYLNLDFVWQFSDNERLDLIAKSRFLIMINSTQVAPIVLTEALSLDVPLLLHSSILSHKKYINEQTGRTFSNEKDIAYAVMEILSSKKIQPRLWFISNFGCERSGSKFYQFLKDIYPSLRYAKHAKYA